MTDEEVDKLKNTSCRYVYQGIWGVSAKLGRQLAMACVRQYESESAKKYFQPDVEFFEEELRRHNKLPHTETGIRPCESGTFGPT